MAASAILATTKHPSDINDEVYALTLQLEELEIQRNNAKGKHKASCPPDSEVAASSLQQQIQDHLQFLRDVSFAHSLACAVDSDATMISALIQDELKSKKDRDMALALAQEESGIDPLAMSKEGDKKSLNDDEHSQLDLLRGYEERQMQLAIMFSDAHEAEKNTEPGPSMTYAERQNHAPKKLHQRDTECIVCGDKVRVCQAVRLECEHNYCKDCLRDFFLRATKDETLLPAKCCRQEIALDHVQSVMSSEELKAYQRAAIENATTDRTYCNNKACGEFIIPIRIGRDRCASCEFCHAETCSACKQAYHEDECPEDPEFQTILDVADELGWKRCFKCKMFVELTHGCNHMTCKCGGEFCYRCSRIWKTCDCSDWEEPHLMHRAREVVDRDAVVPLAPVEHARRVQQVRQELLDQHDCEHPGRFERIFNNSRGAFTCELCDARHWKYILRCRRCHIQVCEDCRRHRV